MSKKVGEWFGIVIVGSLAASVMALAAKFILWLF